MDLNLRRARAADLDAVMALERAAFPPGIVEERAVFERRLKVFSEGFLLAEAAGAPVGYLCAEVWTSWDAITDFDARRFRLGHDAARWLDRRGNTLYIASMAVAPDYRGAGAGRALFRWAVARLLREFPRVRRVVLVVNEHWAAARALYAGEGFTEAGYLPAFFRPAGGRAGDGLVLKKETGRG
jgi:ribosomal protein S18 acetylase RimI-like enzyme